ncbi:MAG: DUF4384 domain-containing protein [Rhodobacteraceae bacterium]|nr:DUF4384 domain-containing protein [Paracoccaceae bacterium]MCY4141363.1 DUF4384 domain-containing protein [Paracoccaceae bacterium]
MKTPVDRPAVPGRSSYAYPAMNAFVLAASTLLVLSVAAGAQELDPPGRVYSTGALPTPAEQIAAMPRTPVYRAHLPEFVDLRDRLPAVGDQGDQGSCTAWAVGYAARSYYNSPPEGGRNLSFDDIPSPAYIYDSIRDSVDNCDEGSYIWTALDLLRDYGAASYADYPYDDDRCSRPGPNAVSQGSRFRIADWKDVDPGEPDQIKAELAGGHPVVIAMYHDERFFELRGPEVWRAGLPDEDDGYHAMTVVGYSEREQQFTLMNSWGQGWGDAGFTYVPYDTFRKRVGEAYTMRLLQAPVPPPPPPPPVPNVEGPDLPAINCGRVAIEERDGEAVIVGFVGSDDDLSAIAEAAEPFDVPTRIDVRPWPQCEAIMTMEEPLAHESPPQIQLPRESYRSGETLAFGVRMAGFQGYLHIAYIQADGNVVNLVQSDPLALATLAPGAELKFGDGLEGRPKFTVSEPFGREMIVALASKSPLFAEDRPLVETEREFLTALRKAIIARPDPGQPERVVSATFMTLETISGD